MQRVRHAQAKYDAAQTTDENRRHWTNTDSLGPNAALNPFVRRVTRDRARYEFANNSYAHGIVRTRAMDVVGTGPMLQCQSGLGPKVDADIEAAFWGWMVATKTPEKLLTLEITKTVCGEWFASFFRNPMIPDAVSLDYQPHEPEMIANPRLGFYGDRRDGILFDDFGNVAGYMLLREHPGEQPTIGLGNSADVIRAADMLHVYNCERPGQVRGISEVVSSLPLFAQLRRYTLAVIRAAETAADVAAILKSMMNPNDPDSEDLEPFDAFELDPGMVLTMPKGWDLTQLKAEQPATTYAMFKREIICEIARCLSMPYNIAAGDSAGYNYSSARLDHRIYAKSIRVERFLIEMRVLDRLFERWWDFAVEADDYLPAEVAELPFAPVHEWRWDGDEYIDPQKEASSADIKIKSGTSHRLREYAIAGLDVNVEDEKAAASYGVTVDEYRAALFKLHFSDGAAVTHQASSDTTDDETEQVDAEDANA